MKTIAKILYPAFALFAVASVLLPRVQAADGGRANGNTAEGWGALGSLTTGSYNTAMGSHALKFLTDGNYNTALGSEALPYTDGSDNVAVGALALFNNTSSQNVAIGTAALRANTIGGGNTAVGENALTSNTSGAIMWRWATARFTLGMATKTSRWVI